jgi:hypothetical protein
MATFKASVLPEEVVVDAAALEAASAAVEVASVVSVVPVVPQPVKLATVKTPARAKLRIFFSFIVFHPFQIKYYLVTMFLSLLAFVSGRRLWRSGFDFYKKSRRSLRLPAQYIVPGYRKSFFFDNTS